MSLSSSAAIRLSASEVMAGGRSVLTIGDLTIPGGEVVAVIGPNGAGKSTLLRVCAGFQPLVRGDVQVAGRSPRHPESRRKIAYVPQALAVAGELPVTVREVVTIGRTGIRGLFRRLTREDHLAVDRWVQRLGLAGIADRAYAETSGGQQRKALLARAMVQEPAILLLDEPTANLDAGAREVVVQALEQLHDSAPLTILLACHELEAIPSRCDRLIILENGRILADGPPEIELTRERVRSLYGQELSVVHVAGRHALVPTCVTERSEKSYVV